MSELTNTRSGSRALRRLLLTSVSLLPFAILAASNAVATDSSADRPTVWIELGGQLQSIGAQGDSFDPAFLAANSDSVVFHPISPLQAEKAPKFAIGGEG